MLEFTVNKLMIEVSSLANPCSEKIVTKVVTLSGEEGVLEAETLSTQIMVCESSQGISRVWNSLGHAILRFLYPAVRFSRPTILASRSRRKPSQASPCSRLE